MKAGIALTAEGALPALRDGPAGPEPDATSFVTALGLRALAAAPGPEAQRLSHRMLGFVTRCEIAGQPGAFAFWPAGRRPVWAAAVPPDTDDSALCLAALHRSGRLGRAETLRRTARAILPNRAPAPDGPVPPWIRRGAFQTWITADRHRPNVIDCAVNANILALLALLGLRGLPGQAEAARMIAAAVDWAGRDPRRLRVLTPFYPDAREFRLAVEAAVAAGCAELAATARRLATLAPGLPGPQDVICSAAYAGAGWRSPALARLRRAALPLSDLQPEKATLP